MTTAMQEKEKGLPALSDEDKADIIGLWTGFIEAEADLQDAKANLARASADFGIGQRRIARKYKVLGRADLGIEVSHDGAHFRELTAAEVQAAKGKG